MALHFGEPRCRLRDRKGKYLLASTYSVSSTLLGLWILLCFVFMSQILTQHFYNPLVRHVGNGGQRVEVTCPRSHSSKFQSQDLTPDNLGSGVSAVYAALSSRKS